MSALVRTFVSPSTVLPRLLARFREARTPALNGAVTIDGFAKDAYAMDMQDGELRGRCAPDAGVQSHAWFTAPAGQVGPHARPAGLS